MKLLTWQWTFHHNSVFCSSWTSGLVLSFSAGWTGLDAAELTAVALCSLTSAWVSADPTMSTATAAGSINTAYCIILFHSEAYMGCNIILHSWCLQHVQSQGVNSTLSSLGSALCPRCDFLSCFSSPLCFQYTYNLFPLLLIASSAKLGSRFFIFFLIF